jgi:hypothetical protein
MRQECVIRSVKSDLKEVKVIGIILAVLAVTWYIIVTNYDTIAALMSNVVIPVLVIVILIDLFCIWMSTMRFHNTDTKITPFWAPFLVFILFQGLIVIAYNASPLNLPSINTAFILNAIVTVAAMIGVRVWMRCKDENNEKV